MWQDIFNLAVNNGLWAVLFLVLLGYVLKDSRAREEKYQETIDKLGKAVSTIEGIKEDVEEIKEKINVIENRKNKKKQVSENAKVQ